MCMIWCRAHLLQGRQHEAERLARARARLGQDVPPLEDDGDGGGLDGRAELKAQYLLHGPAD